MARVASTNRPLYVLLALALFTTAFTLLPFGHGHDAACAHDLSGVCVPDAELDPGDLATKATYTYEAQPAGAPGTAPDGMEHAGRAKTIGHADPGTGFNADVVAHRGHAYLGSWGADITDPEDPPPVEELENACPSLGVRVYDLSDPSQPTQVSTFADAAGDPEVFGSWTEKVIVERVRTRDFRGDLAAVSFQSCRDAEGFRGFGVYDVSDPANPRKLALVETDPRANGSHELWLEARHGRAYVYTAIILSEYLTSPDGVTPGPDPDLQIWDVSDPESPARVGEWGAWAELGIPPIEPVSEEVTRVRFVHSVQQDRTTLYVSYWDLGTVMLDMRDPAEPVYLGRTEFDADEEGNAHSSWVARGGRLLVQTDEDFSPEPGEEIEQAWGYARLYDNTNPANPRQIATFELPTTRQYPPPGPGFFSVHDPKIRGNTLYLSHYAQGVVGVDISRPWRPRMIGQFLPEPAEDPRGFFFPGEEYVNVWGVFVDRNYVLASDINSGLWVFRL